MTDRANIIIADTGSRLLAFEWLFNLILTRFTCQDQCHSQFDCEKLSHVVFRRMSVSTLLFGVFFSNAKVGVVEYYDHFFSCMS